MQQISNLNREIGALTEQLQPAQPDNIARHLLSMRKAGMALPVGMKPEDLEPVYGYALSEVPAYGLRRAVEKIIKGEYDIERGFIPRPPELAAMSRAEAKVVRDDLVRLREKMATLEDLKHKPAAADEGAKARVRAILERFRAEHKAAKAQERGVVVHEPMTAEQAEYYAKINALKDAPNITAEQLAHRRKIGMELEKLADEVKDDRSAA